MGLVKAWLMEQANEERHAEFRAWFRDKYGRTPNDADEAKHWDDFEMDEAIVRYEMSKDD